MSRRRATALRLALLAAATGVALLVLEASVRIALSLDPNTIDALTRPPATVVGRDLTLLDLLRTHPDDRVVYELRPEVGGTFFGHEVRINRLGMRDVERPFEKPPGTFRIVGLGDSHAFGWGVDRDETYLAVLEALCRERSPSRRFEVWNLAVPGYNTVQEVRAFELRAREIDADLVVVNYVDNDMDLPNFLAERPSPWTRHRIYLRELVARRLAVLRHEILLPPNLAGVEPEPRTLRYRMDPDRIPERYRPLYGWKNMEAAFLRLLAIGRERRFRAALLFNPDDYRALLRGWRTDARDRPVRDLAKRLARAGYVVVDPQARILEHLRAHGLPASAVWVSTADPHSSPLRHRLLAEALLETLVEAGAL